MSFKKDKALAHLWSSVKNLKELRGTVNRVEWRVAYAFDSKRRAVLLCAGAKGGSSEDLFYKQPIATAEVRFERYRQGVT